MYWLRLSNNYYNFVIIPRFTILIVTSLIVKILRDTVKTLGGNSRDNNYFGYLLEDHQLALKCVKAKVYKYEPNKDVFKHIKYVISPNLIIKSS